MQFPPPPLFRLSPSYNIAPLDNSNQHTVEYITSLFIKSLGQGSYKIDEHANFSHETQRLRLDSSLIQEELGWLPLFNTNESIIQTALEYKTYLDEPDKLKNHIDSFISEYINQRTF